MTRFLTLVFVLAGLTSTLVACDGEQEGHPAASSSPAPKPALQFTPQPNPHPKYMTVTGPGDDVAAFVIRYQDDLWPEWRTRERYGCEMFINLQRVRRTGRALIWTGDEISRKAFYRAKVTTPVAGIDY